MDVETWKRKRRHTLVAFMYQVFLNGLERGTNFATLWVYLTTLVQTKQPELVYGLATVTFYAPPVLFAMVVARFADKTGQIRLILFICNFLNMLGSIVYIIPYSSYFVIAGQTLLGFSIITRPVTSGEIARLYPTSPNKIPVMVSPYFLGLLLGPLLAASLQHVKFSIFNIPITYGNISGIILFFLYIFGQFSVTFLASDLSNEYNYAEHNNSIETGKDEQEEKANQRSSFYHVLWKMFQSFDIMLIMLLTFHVAFHDIAFCRLIPVIIMNSISFPYYYVTIFYEVYAIAAFGLLIGLIKTKLKQHVIHYCSLISVAAILISGLSQMLLINGNMETAGKTIFIVIFACTVTIAEIGEQIFLIVILSKMVSTQNKSYVESIRSVVKQVGCLSGGFLSAYLVRSSTLFLIVTLATCLLFVILLSIRRKSFLQPQIIVK